VRCSVRDFGQPRSFGTMAMFLGHGHVRKQTDLLDDVPDVTAQVSDRDIVDLSALHVNRPGSRLDQPVDQCA